MLTSNVNEPCGPRFRALHLSLGMIYREEKMQACPPRVPQGKIKSFGPLGPRYPVGQPLRPVHNGDWMISIVLVETGEQTEYRLSRLDADPEAH